MNRFTLMSGLLAASLLPSLTPQVLAQQPAERVETADDAAATQPDRPGGEQMPPAAAEPDRERKLAEYLSGAIFSGRFTIDGREDAAPKMEQYTISKCEKLDAPDMYRMTARIKYGEIDSEVPLDIKILWSGNTPVITLDSFWIPAMGTFGARILIHSGRYAGTWQHDAVGGHMFGQIKK